MLPGLHSAPKEYANKLQMYLAVRHSKKICWTDSCSVQKAQVVFPFHLHLHRLSFVRMASCETNHMKILIFNGTFAFHILLKLMPYSSLHKCL
jgi:hypothetical protein